jgi:PAS domain-containing protein
MGASGAVAVRHGRTPAKSEAAANGGRPGRVSPAAPLSVIEFAARRLAVSRPPLDALPGVLKRLTVDFDCQAALAFSLTEDPLPFAAAAYLADAATEELLAELKVLSVLHTRRAASGGSFTARISSAGPDARSTLVAFSAPGACERTCALALTGPTRRWDAQVRSALRTLASVVGGAVSRSELISHPLAGVHQPDDGDARFRLLSRLAPVGIVQFDAAGQCTYVNDRLCEWTGISQEGAGLGRSDPGRHGSGRPGRTGSAA